MCQELFIISHFTLVYYNLVPTAQTVVCQACAQQMALLSCCSAAWWQLYNNDGLPQSLIAFEARISQQLVKAQGSQIVTDHLQITKDTPGARDKRGTLWYKWGLFLTWSYHYAGPWFLYKKHLINTGHDRNKTNKGIGATKECVHRRRQLADLHSTTPLHQKVAAGTASVS